MSDRSLESPHFCLLRVLPLRGVLVCSAWRSLQHNALIQTCIATLSPPARACSARATAPPPLARLHVGLGLVTAACSDN